MMATRRSAKQWRETEQQSRWRIIVSPFYLERVSFCSLHVTLESQVYYLLFTNPHVDWILVRFASIQVFASSTTSSWYLTMTLFQQKNL
jgi:hypothetical protein